MKGLAGAAEKQMEVDAPGTRELHRRIKQTSEYAVARLEAKKELASEPLEILQPACQELWDHATAGRAR